MAVGERSGRHSAEQVHAWFAVAHLFCRRTFEDKVLALRFSVLRCVIDLDATAGGSDRSVWRTDSQDRICPAGQRSRGLRRSARSWLCHPETGGVRAELPGPPHPGWLSQTQSPLGILAALGSLYSAGPLYRLARAETPVTHFVHRSEPRDAFGWVRRRIKIPDPGSPEPRR